MAAAVADTDVGDTSASVSPKMGNERDTNQGTKEAGVEGVERGEERGGLFHTSINANTRASPGGISLTSAPPSPSRDLPQPQPQRLNGGCVVQVRRYFVI